MTGVARDPVPGLYGRDGSRKYLNRMERQRVLAAMQGLDPGRALFALTLAWTGARVSEVLALTPSSFQIESGIVAINTLKRRRPVVREVPIPPALMRALDAHFALARTQQRQNEAQQRLWPWNRVTAWRLIRLVMRRSGIAGRQACPRGLRHAFGVGGLQAGVPLNLVQRWLGHARMSTTAIYADACGPEEAAMAERFWRSTESLPPTGSGARRRHAP
ncbi:integrase family protein [Rhodovulum sp. PH10]|uniref:tyrosine-type recombinase/integrase n=1 Tax=Rhodovulum sp. PH10 TaxID=1187851 RepID=UPI00027C23C0|nr:site-specific integrase [Rhodovulum sp. PH10]EJW10831.1 integrase family protein [Rhodovulum sp. PH10]